MENEKYTHETPIGGELENFDIERDAELMARENAKNKYLICNVCKGKGCIECTEKQLKGVIENEEFIVELEKADYEISCENPTEACRFYKALEKKRIKIIKLQDNLIRLKQLKK